MEADQRTVHHVVTKLGEIHGDLCMNQLSNYFWKILPLGICCIIAPTFKYRFF